VALVPGPLTCVVVPIGVLVVGATVVVAVVVIGSLAVICTGPLVAVGPTTTVVVFDSVGSVVEGLTVVLVDAVTGPTLGVGDGETVWVVEVTGSSASAENGASASAATATTVVMSIFLPLRVISWLLSSVSARLQRGTAEGVERDPPTDLRQGVDARTTMR